ncbi:hypothetical protein [Polaribacter cellanae]|uniref:Uncharacterized protein n=1 Tax=Polaribacter cellanae TaxID=2818493 RepID=A0A975CM31_9FLAO|nr:hypothetical protein [Polaribacter cellanae]QTE21114.1 hypothetical protein J3359_09650 [Polaribacter cellanae]
MKLLSKKAEKKNGNKTTEVLSFMFQKEQLEKELHQEHEAIKNEISIPLAKDLGAMNKPEADCDVDVYTKVIRASYAKMIAKAKKEIGPEIESYHIVSEREIAKEKKEALNKELEKKEKELRIKERQLEECDNSLIKKDRRYKYIRIFLLFICLVDVAISSVALMAMGYNMLTSYIVGIGIGGAIFFVSEQIQNIASKGKNSFQKRLILGSTFLFAFLLFYVLGMFRATQFSSGVLSNSEGVKPIYFACLNLFFFAASVITVFQKKLSPVEQKIIDKWKIVKGEVEILTRAVNRLKQEKETIRLVQSQSELARQKIQLYAQDLQELIQRLFEESQHTFYSTNAIHRSDGKTPLFFKQPIQQLPSFYKGFNL